MTMLIKIEILFFFEESVGEELITPHVNSTDMGNKYLIQVIDLRSQVDHIILKQIQQHKDYRGATNIARLLMITIRHREFKMILDGIKITEVTDI